MQKLVILTENVKKLPSLPYLIFNFDEVSTVPTADFFVTFSMAVWLL